MAAKKEGFTDKLIRLPDDLWESLKQDSARCRRSSNGQIEAILMVYFGKDNVALLKVPNPDDMDGERPERSKSKGNVVEQNDFLMSDPKGANAGTKRLPVAIQKDIADAKAHVKKLKQQRS